MRTLILNTDLKTLFSGVSLAAAAGLLLGGMMYPDLNAGTIKGPQMLMAGGGPRASLDGGESGLSAYHGRIPEYVIGTDATRPAQYAVLAYQERAEETADTGDTADVMAYEAPAEIQPVRYQDEPREPVAYPSQRGNQAYEIDLPAPPAPPAADDDEPFGA